MVFQLFDYDSESEAKKLIYFDTHYKKNYDQVFAFGIVTRCIAMHQRIESLEIRKRPASFTGRSLTSHKGTLALAG